ncbi:MAG: uL15m family ribosomal protein [Thermoplasmata archaeon]
MGRTKRLRGYRTHGRGQKAGRGKGKRGGRGMAGLLKHKFKWMIKYDPDHFGSRGFKRPKGLKRPVRTLNLGELQESMEGFVQKGFAQRRDGGYEVNLTAAGIQKLLGRGNVNVPLRIIVPSATAKATEKVEKAGGELVLGPTEG